MTANYTTTDLIYGQKQGQSFGEITYTIIKNNSLQPAKVGLITYIPKDLNDKLDAKILEYAAQFARETAADAAAHKQEEMEREKENPFEGLNPVSTAPVVPLDQLGSTQASPTPAPVKAAAPVKSPAPSPVPTDDRFNESISWGDDDIIPLDDPISPPSPPDDIPDIPMMPDDEGIVDLRGLEEETAGLEDGGDGIPAIDDLLG